MRPLSPPSKTDNTQNANPAAIRFHLADTLNVARQNRTNAKTRRIMLIMKRKVSLRPHAYKIYFGCSSVGTGLVGGFTT
jgi:hypothetical protein